ncbi:MAG: protein kinase [Candidatus Brocadiae bacterium]|nr:protein kinase [Candidatus Brocadiia bacterium]
MTTHRSSIQHFQQAIQDIFKKLNKENIPEIEKIARDFVPLMIEICLKKLQNIDDYCKLSQFLSPEFYECVSEEKQKEFLHHLGMPSDAGDAFSQEPKEKYVEIAELQEKITFEYGTCYKTKLGYFTQLDNGSKILPESRVEKEAVLECDINQGGFKSVYRIKIDEKKYALAVLKTKSCNEESLERFWTELKTIYKIKQSESNLCPELHGFQFAREEGIFFAISEYMGKNLDQYIEEREELRIKGNYSYTHFREDMQIFHKIDSKIIRLHQLGYIHRDIKSLNILLDEKNEPYIIDFGTTRKLEDRIENLSMRPETAPGQIMGTLQYIDDLFLINPSNNGYWSDLWSLGIMLYEMIVGRIIYPNKVAELRMSKIRAGVAELSEEEKKDAYTESALDTKNKMEKLRKALEKFPNHEIFLEFFQATRIMDAKERLRKCGEVFPKLEDFFQKSYPAVFVFGNMKEIPLYFGSLLKDLNLDVEDFHPTRVNGLTLFSPCAEKLFHPQNLDVFFQALSEGSKNHEPGTNTIPLKDVQVLYKKEQRTLPEVHISENLVSVTDFNEFLNSPDYNDPCLWQEIWKQENSESRFASVLDAYIASLDSELSFIYIQPKKSEIRQECIKKYQKLLNQTRYYLLQRGFAFRHAPSNDPEEKLPSENFCKMLDILTKNFDMPNIFFWEANTFLYRFFLHLEEIQYDPGKICLNHIFYPIQGAFNSASNWRIHAGKVVPPYILRESFVSGINFYQAKGYCLFKSKKTGHKFEVAGQYFWEALIQNHPSLWSDSFEWCSDAHAPKESQFFDTNTGLIKESPSRTRQREKKAEFDRSRAIKGFIKGRTAKKDPALTYALPELRGYQQVGFRLQEYI